MVGRDLADPGEQLRRAPPASMATAAERVVVGQARAARAARAAGSIGSDVGGDRQVVQQRSVAGDGDLAAVDTTAPTGICSITWILMPCGNWVLTRRSLTTGNGATAVCSWSMCTSSVVMLRAAATSAVADLRRVGTARAGDRHALDRDQRGVAQPEPAAAEQQQRRDAGARTEARRGRAQASARRSRARPRRTGGDTAPIRRAGLARSSARPQSAREDRRRRAPGPPARARRRSAP